MLHKNLLTRVGKAPFLFHWDESQNPIIIARGRAAPVAIRGREIDRAVRPFRDIAYAPVLLLKQTLLTDDAAAVQDHANDRLAAQASEEEVAAKLREQCAAIERAARGRDRRRVFEKRRFQAFARLRVMNNRPAVGLPLLYYVDFVAAARCIATRRPMLRLEHRVRARLPVNPLRIA